MVIKGRKKIIQGGEYIQMISSDLLLYHISEKTYLNEALLGSRGIYAYENKLGINYLKSFTPSTIYKLLDGQLYEILRVEEGGICLGVDSSWYILSDYINRENHYSLYRDGLEVWHRINLYMQLKQIGRYGLFWFGSGAREGSCELIDIESGATIWEKDYPNTYIKFVYAYEDRLVLQYGSELKYRDYRKLRCLSMQTGEVLWESDVLGNYEPYGSSKLVSFWSHLHVTPFWNHNEYAELDIKTGEVKTKYFPEFFGDVTGLMVYKDYLFFSIQNRMSIGIIDLKSQEIIQEYSVEYTPGEFNQLKSKGVYAGCLYLEVMTDVNHSDIHVFELAED